MKKEGLLTANWPSSFSTSAHSCLDHDFCHQLRED